jgi:hypothetical protein
MKALIVAWMAITAAMLWWPTHSTDFQTRWVAMPPAMTWVTFETARKASVRPSFCVYHHDADCRLS